MEINELYGFLAVVSLRLMWAWVRWCSGNVGQWWSASDWLDFDFDRRSGIGDLDRGSGILILIGWIWIGDRGSEIGWIVWVSQLIFDFDLDQRLASDWLDFAQRKWVV